MMEREAAGGEVELAGPKRHPLDVAERESDVGDSAARRLGAGARDQSVGGVDPEHAPALGRERHRDKARPAGDVEHARVRPHLRNLHHVVEDARVGDDLHRRVSLGLAAELLLHQGQIVRRIVRSVLHWARSHQVRSRTKLTLVCIRRIVPESRWSASPGRSSSTASSSIARMSGIFSAGAAPKLVHSSIVLSDWRAIFIATVKPCGGENPLELRGRERAHVRRIA